MFSKLTFLICAAFAIFSVVQATPSNTVRSHALDTNANRFRRGLPPLPQIKRRPTRVAAAKRYSPSNLPGMSYEGYICAYTTANPTASSKVGCLKRDLNSDGLYTLTTVDGNRLPVQFNAATSSTSSQFDITDKYNNRPSSPYMGGAGSASLTASSGNYVALAGVSQTAGGAPPQSGSTTYASGGSVASAIWGYVHPSKAIKPQWVNTGGSTPPTRIAYNENQDGRIVLTANVPQYCGTSLNKGCYEIFFFFQTS